MKIIKGVYKGYRYIDLGCHGETILNRDDYGRIHLDEVCSPCDKRSSSEMDKECESCGGSGFILNDNGKNMLLFLLRHVDNSVLSEMKK